MKIGKKIIWIIALILVVVLIGMVGYGYYKKITMKDNRPIATMEVEGYGKIRMELYPEQAPEAVSNFIALANRGYYNGSSFHRVVKDFMIQGGTKNGDGTTGAKESDLKDGGEDKDYSIKGEFVSNNVNNTVRFTEGTLGVARSDYTSYDPSLDEESYNSGNAQFFIMTEDNNSLDGNYTAFGKVIEGMDVVHSIENVETKVADDSEETGNTEQSVPVTPIKIISISVETNGIDYGLPNILTPFDYQSWFYDQYMSSYVE